MLLKNNRKPEVAYATYGGSRTDDRSVKNDFITRMSADGDDFGNFGSTSAPKNKKKQPNKAPQKGPNRSSGNSFFDKFSKKSGFMPIVFAGIAVIALLVIIALIAVACSLPGSSSKKVDTVYFTYIDDEQKYHVVVNGEELKEPFENEIEVIPSADNSFAYVLEKIEDEDEDESGTQIHILKGKKLTTSEQLADECVSFADLKPGVIYLRDERYYYYTEKSNAPIVAKSSGAKDFIISDNANAIVYTMPSKDDEGTEILRYDQNSVAEDISERVTPLAISADGRYVYGQISEETGGKYAGNLCAIDTKQEEPKLINLTPAKGNYGTFGEITSMNASGNEIIFYTLSDSGINSFHLNLNKKLISKLGQGVFKHVSVDSAVLTPNTFIGEYFTVQDTAPSYDEDGELEVNETDTYATYCLKKDGAKKIADAIGKFSPDGDYFYYIDKNSQLCRIPLSAKDYEKSTESVLECITEFSITQKGDVYMFSTLGSQDNKPALLYFWDSSTKNTQMISERISQNNMDICANTVYFSEKVKVDGEVSTAIYTSTDGTKKSPADFKGIELTKAPTIIMGTGSNGYAYVTDDDGTTMLFYTTNGKKFNVVSKSCTLPEVKNSPIG